MGFKIKRGRIKNSVRDRTYAIMRQHFHDLGTVATAHNIQMDFPYKHRWDVTIEEIEQVLNSLEQKGLLTPAGIHTGRRHLTEKGYEWMRNGCKFLDGVVMK